MAPILATNTTAPSGSAGAPASPMTRQVCRTMSSLHCAAIRSMAAGAPGAGAAMAKVAWTGLGGGLAGGPDGSLAHRLRVGSGRDCDLP